MHLEPPQRSLRVLVADDSQDCRESLALLLRLHGYEVCEAADGRETVERTCSFRPDAVLLDIAMPRMDGHAAARLLRQTPGLEDILIVAISGYGTTRDVLAAREAGCDHHLLKPYHAADVFRLLETAHQPREACRWPRTVPTLLSLSEDR